MSEHFGDVLKELVQQENRTPGQLARLTDIPKQTIVTWLEGRVRHPRSWQDLVRLSHALHLPQPSANRLFRAAGHPPAQKLLEKASRNGEPDLLTMLRRLLATGTGSSAAPISAPFQALPRLNNFVGRQELLEQVRQALLDGQICLLHGMGGVGKSAVARELAYLCRADFPDGVLWASLDEAISKTGEVNGDVLHAILGTFAQAYGRSLDEEYDLASRSRIVRELLARKRALVVLDNAHSSQDATPLLPPTTGKCGVLITTRNRRMLRSRAQPVSVAPLTPQEGNRLLAQFVGNRRIRQEAEGAAKILSLLGGLPLAVKVVGSDLAETGSLTLQEYGDLLLDERSRLEFLADWEDASKDVRASFALSYRRLPPALQQLFVSLAVFGGADFGAEAVAAVTGTKLPSTKRQLDRLHALSLLEADAQPVAAAAGLTPVRYRLHPLLHTFAREQLVGSGVQADTQRRAARYFLDLAAANARSQALLQQEWTNILGALRWAVQQDDREQLRLAIDGLTEVHLGTAGFMDARGHWQEAARLLALLLDEFAADTDPWLTGSLHFRLGLFAYRLAQPERAAKNLETAVSLLETPDPPPDRRLLLAQLYELQAQLTFDRGESDKAFALAERGLNLLSGLETDAARHETGYLTIRQGTMLARCGRLDEARLGTKSGIAMLPSEPTPARVSGLITLGTILFFQGETEEALAAWREGIPIAQALGDNRRLAGLWQNIGSACTIGGRLVDAAGPKQEALALYEQIGDVHGAALLHSNLGEDAILRRKPETAERHLEQALALAAQHDLPDVELFARVNRARWHLDRQQLPDAESQLTQAEVLAEQLDDTGQQAEITRLLAELTFLHGEPEPALAQLEPLLAGDSSPKEQGLGRRLQGRILWEQREKETAVAAYRQSMELFAGTNPFELARTQLALARHYLEAGEPAAAHPLLTEARAAFTRLQLDEYAAETAVLLETNIA